MDGAPISYRSQAIGDDRPARTKRIAFLTAVADMFGGPPLSAHLTRCRVSHVCGLTAQTATSQQDEVSHNQACLAGLMPQTCLRPRSEIRMPERTMNRQVAVDVCEVAKGRANGTLRTLRGRVR